MAKQSKNIVKIVGVLVENSLKNGTYKKDGKESEYISGVLTIRVKQQISGKEEISDIPVNVYVGKYTKDGSKINPAYDSMTKAMGYTSIAVTNDESTATKVFINMGSLSENIYSIDGEKIFCTPRINSSFINSSTNGGNYTPEATFTTDMVVGKIDDENNLDGTPTGRLKVKGMVSRYNGTMDVLDYIVENPNAINYIRTYWHEGDTVQVSGKIRFSVKTEQIEIPTRFGDPVFKTKTSTCRELIITADSSDVLTPEQKFTEEEVKYGLEERNKIIETAKERAKKTSTSTNSTGTTATAASNSYGF